MLVPTSAVRRGCHVKHFLTCIPRFERQFAYEKKRGLTTQNR